MRVATLSSVVFLLGTGLALPVQVQVRRKSLQIQLQGAQVLF